MMKVRLLTGGDYSFLDGAEFPAIVDAVSAKFMPGIEVHYSQIRKCGAVDKVWMNDSTIYFLESQYEVVDE